MRKRRRRGDIFIDLTSLLDVVMIVLLVVICHLQMLETSANDQNSETKEQLQAAEMKLGEAEEAADLYKEQLNAMEGMSEYLVFISVSIPYDENPEIRHIRLTSTDDADGKIREIADLKGAEVSEGYEELEQYLKNTASKNPDKTIVRSLNKNEDRILYRDQERVLELFDSLAAVCENVRARES